MVSYPRAVNGFPPAPRTIETEYCPTYIPEGYVEDACLFMDVVIVRTWKNENGEYLSFQQDVIIQEGQVDGWNGGHHVDAENGSADYLVLNGFEVFRVRSFSTMYHWTDNSYFYQLTFDPSLGEEEAYRIFSSIAPVENPGVPIN